MKTLQYVLSNQLNILQNNVSESEWTVFCLAYYDDLSIQEICLVLDLSLDNVHRLIDSVLCKAVTIMGENFKYVSCKKRCDCGM